MTTYTPKTRQPQAPALAGALPKDLADALTTAERVLTEHDRVLATLQRTHTLIPELLARRAAVQSDARAAREQRLTVESERLSAVSQRQGAIEALLSQETELTAARDALNVGRQSY